jgi:glycosyltransferase involved in cell wall biosynthesis
MISKHCPLVSVVIPTYNHADFLQKAIRSVLDQTYQDFEIIIVDNNSTDHTNEVVASFDDKRINMYKINNCGVIGASRNLGVGKARGKWIAYLDSDDYWYSTKLANLAIYLDEHSQYDVLSAHEYKRHSSTGKKTKLMYGPLAGDKYRSLLLYGNRLSPSASIIRKSFLLGNGIVFSENTNFITVEDYDYWLQLARFNASFKFINSFEGEYLVHGSNSSGFAEVHKRNELNLLRHHVFNVQKFEENKEKLWTNMLSVILLRESFQKLKSGSVWLFVYGLLMSLYSSPYFLSKWILHKLGFFIKIKFLSDKI